MEEIALVRTNPSVFVEVQIWFMISVRLLDTGSGKESREKPLTRFLKTQSFPSHYPCSSHNSSLSPGIA